jgi:hypothetical protein
VRKGLITDAMNRCGSVEVSKFHFEARRKHPVLAGKDENISGIDVSMGTADVSIGPRYETTSNLQACSLVMRSSTKVLYLVDSLCKAHQASPEVHALLRCSRPNVLVE